VGVALFVPCCLLGPNGGLLFNLRITQKRSTQKSLSS
jgi:hypothetical protein